MRLIWQTAWVRSTCHDNIMSYLHLSSRHEKLSCLLLWRTFLAQGITSSHFGSLLPAHPSLKWGEIISRRSVVLSSQEPRSSTTSPGSLWLISYMITESFLATPNYMEGWQVCLVTFCQYHLMLSFHPALLLPAKTKTPKITLPSGWDSETAPAKSPNTSNSVQSHKAGATRTGEQKISHLQDCW